MVKTKLKYISSILVLVCMLLTHFFIAPATKVDAYLTSNTTGYVSVGELWKGITGKVDADNYQKLLNYLAGKDDATIADIDSLADNVTTAAGIREVEYDDKSNGQGVVVTVGGITWQVVYLSKDADGNSIATLYMSNGVQKLFNSRIEREGEYYGFRTWSSIDRSLASDFSANWSSNSNGNYPSNMYGTSYVRAVTLNNGGKYALSTSTLSEDFTSSGTSVFAPFTTSSTTDGLRSIMVTPAVMSWQENQSAKTLGVQSYNVSNEGWSTNTPNDGYSSANYNYASKTGYDTWKNDYVWLPSASEVRSIWSLNSSELKIQDGVSWSGGSSVGSNNSGSISSDYWLRSAATSSYSTVLDVNYQNVSVSSYSANNTEAIRAAIHINLTAAAEKVSDDEGDFGATWGQTEPVLPTGVTEWGELFNYTTTGTTSATITSLKDEFADVHELVVPAVIDGYNVTKLNITGLCTTGADTNTNLYKVFIEDRASSSWTVEYTSSGGYKTPFNRCPNLIYAYVGSKAMYSYMFYGCSNLKTCTLSDAITSISSCAFQYCSSLTTVNCSDNVTTISSYTFDGCTALRNFEFPANLKTIDGYAFRGTQNFTVVNIPLSVTSISDYAFGYCGTITEVHVPDNYYATYFGGFNYCTGLTKVTFGDNVTINGTMYGFPYCTNLTSVTFGENFVVTGSMYNTFQECTNLVMDFTIPDGVTSLSGTFKNCYNMNISWGEFPQVKTISSEAFRGCNFVEFTVPSTVTSLGGLGYNRHLKSIIFAPGCQVTTLSSSVFESCTSLTEFTVPTTVTKTGSNTFYNCTGLKAVTLHDGITSIGDNAFFGCSSLQTINLPSGITSIASQTFYNCSKLQSIIIPAGVTTIGTHAFSGCSSLTSVTIPKGVTKLNYYTFRDCYALTEVNFAEGSALTTIDYSCFYDCTSLQSFTLPESVTTINYQAFYNCTQLREFNISESSQLNTIEYQCFYNCTNLRSFYLPANVTTLKYSTFQNCSQMTEFAIAGNTKLTTIEYNCFAKCASLVSFTLPDSVTTIQAFAFYNCSKLTTFNINTTSKLREIGYNPQGSSYNGRTFAYSGITSIYLPDSLTIMYSHTAYGSGSGISESSYPGNFSYCLNLETVSYSDNLSLTSIPAYTFYMCGKINNFQVWDACKSFGDFAFSNIYNVIIPSSVANGERTLPTVSSKAFNVNEPTRIYVATGDKATYVANSGWSAFASIIVDLPLTITFELNGGEGVDNITWTMDDLLAGNLVSPVIPNPTKDGYNFAGWFTTSDFSTASYHITGREADSMTLYAKWFTDDEMINGTAFTFVVANGTASLTGLKVEYSGLSSLTIPSWVTDETGTYRVSSIGSDTISNNQFIENIYFDAECNATISTSAFNNNPNLLTIEIGTSPVTLNTRIALGCPKLYAINVDNSTHKSIDGIVYNADGTTLYLVPNGLYTVSISIGCTTIGSYAFDTMPNLTEITFNDVITINSNGIYDCDKISLMKLGKVEVLQGDAINGLGNLSYIESGSLKSLSSYAIRDCSNFATLILSIEAVPTISGSAIYNVNSGLRVYVPTFAYNNYLNSNWKSYKLVAYDLPVGGGSSEIVLVTFDYAGGIGSIETTVVVKGSVIGTLIDPVRTGYSFTGYKLVNSSTNQVTGSILDLKSYTFEQNTTIRAIWNPLTYYIYYHLNGGQVTDTSSGSYNEGTGIFTYRYNFNSFGEGQTEELTVITPSMEGHDFIGWYENAEFDSKKITSIIYDYLTIAQIEGREAITLYAKWEIQTFSVVINDATGFDISVANGYTNPVAWNNDFKWTFTFKEGYTQNTSENITVSVSLNGGEYQELTVTVEEGIEYYVIPQVTCDVAVKVDGVVLNTYKMYFLSGRASEYSTVTNLPSAQDVTHGQNVSTVASPSAGGYDFVGWYEVTIDEATGEDVVSDTVFNFNAGVINEVRLQAVWQAIEYTITYTLNGGKLGASEATNFTDTYTIEDVVVLPQPHSLLYPFVRTGYNFSNWYENARLNGNVYDFTEATLVTSFGSRVYGDKEFVVKWEVIEYGITYHTNDGTISGEYVRTYTVDDTFELPVPSKNGHTFVAWYLNERLTGNTLSTVEAGTTGNITVYAKYTTNTYTITYHLNGSELSPVYVNGNSISAANNEYVDTYAYSVDSVSSLLTNVTREGYAFAGWYAQSNFADNRVYSIEAGVTGDKEYYALWTMESYEIPLYYGSEYVVTNEPTSVEFTYADLEENDNKLSIYTPSLAGYYFQGWYDQNGILVPYITKQNCASITRLTARWSNESYELTVTGTDVDKIRLLGADGTIQAVYGGTIKFVVDYLDARYNRSVVAVSYKMNGNTEYTAVPYGQDGYYTISNIVGDLEIKIDGIILNAYVVEFETNGGNTLVQQSVTHGTKATVPSTPTRTGYDFVNWYEDSALTNEYDFDTEVTKDLVLYAKWSPTTYNYTITNNINSESITGTYNVENIVVFSDAHKFAIAGYDFASWKIGEASVTSTSGLIGDQTIVATYVPITYTITYAVDNGLSNNLVTSYTILSEDIVLNDASKEGYSFTGWALEDDNNGHIVIVKDSTTYIQAGSYGNIVLTATFVLESALYYELTFKEGELILTQRAVKIADGRFEGEVEPLGKAGHEFVGWYEQGSNTAFDLDGVITSSVTLYARYEVQQYEITYNLGVWTSATHTNPTELEYSDTMVTLSDAVLAGYNFIGWYTESTYTNKVTALVRVNADTELYAKFEIIRYSIEYHLDGGTNSQYNPSSYTVEDSEITLYEATKEGYSFDGWYLADDTKVTSIDPSTCTNYTLSARYTVLITHSEVEYFYGNELLNRVSVEKGTVPEEYEPTVPAGRTFEGWYTNVELTDEYRNEVINEDTTLYAKYGLITYKITYTFNKNGAINHTNGTEYNVDSLIVLTDATFTGYEFEGWYSGEDRVTVIDDMTGNLSLQGRFTPINYTIKYYYDGEELTNTGNASTYNVEEEVTLEGIQIPGYEFKGWKHGEEIISTTSGKTENLVLFAEVELEEYTITYTYNNKVGTPTNTNITSFDITTNQTLLGCVVPGYMFDGWYIGDSKITSIQGLMGDITIQARFTPITYFITYTMDEGASHTNRTSYTVEDEDFELTDASIDGRTFIGWKEGERYVSTIDTSRAQHITLVSIFTAPAGVIEKDTNNTELITTLVAVGVAVAAVVTISVLGTMVRKLRKKNKVDVDRMMKVIDELNQHQRTRNGARNYDNYDNER